jgi:C-terminal processing protease CtpA/Prc
MVSKKFSSINYFLIFICLCFFICQNTYTQTIIKENKRDSPESVSKIRERGAKMLDDIKDVIKFNYYDSKLRGIDIDEKVKQYKAIIKTCKTNGEVFRVIAQLFLDFKDSHMFFIPQSRINRINYGFTTKVYGDSVYIVSVRKGSDTESKGVKVGFKLKAINNYEATRESNWILTYLFNILEPRESINLSIVDFEGNAKEIVINAKVYTPEELQKLSKEFNKTLKENKEKPKEYKCHELSKKLIVCKFYSFSVDKDVVDNMMKEVSDYESFILDLRNNGGGYITTMKHFIGYFFDKDVVIGTEKTRTSMKTVKAESHGKKTYNGKLTILIDSNSASASEVMSRVIQLNKRGKIIGDRSSGSVMASIQYPMTYQIGGIDSTTFSNYAVSVTVADLIMDDEMSLENIGVIPDTKIIPKMKDLIEEKDLALSFASWSNGVPLEAKEAFQIVREKLTNRNMFDSSEKKKVEDKEENEENN